MEEKTLTVSVNKKALSARYARTLVPVWFAVLVADWFLMPKAGVLRETVAVLATVCFAVMFFSVVNGSGAVALTFHSKSEYRGAYVGIRSKANSFEVYDIPGSDCVITQTEKQAAQDRGNIRFKNTRLNYYEVENVSAVKAFLEEYFPADK